MAVARLSLQALRLQQRPCEVHLHVGRRRPQARGAAFDASPGPSARWQLGYMHEGIESGADDGKIKNADWDFFFDDDGDSDIDSDYGDDGDDGDDNEKEEDEENEEEVDKEKLEVKGAGNSTGGDDVCLGSEAAEMFTATMTAAMVVCTRVTAHVLVVAYWLGCAEGGSSTRLTLAAPMAQNVCRSARRDSAGSRSQPSPRRLLRGQRSLKSLRGIASRLRVSLPLPATTVPPRFHAAAAQALIDWDLVAVDQSIGHLPKAQFCLMARLCIITVIGFFLG